MRNNLYCRILTIEDIPLLKDAIRWQTHKYGYPVDHNEVELRLTNHIKNGDKHRCIVGCFDGETMVGINSHFGWEKLPFWSFATLIIKPSYSGQGIMSQKQIDILASLLEFNCKIGENNQRYDWITVTQDTTLSRKSRHFKIMNEIYDRYTSVDLDVAMPGQPFKWPYLQGIISDKPFKHPLVIKLFSLKNELRPCSWVNVNKNLRNFG